MKTEIKNKKIHGKTKAVQKTALEKMKGKTDRVERMKIGNVEMKKEKPKMEEVQQKAPR